MNFLFPYMARWKAVNWTRYHQIFNQLAELGHEVHVIQAPPNNNLEETNFQEINVGLHKNLYLHDVSVNPFIWNRTFPLNKLVKKGYYSFKCFKKAKQIIQEYNIDILFLYNIPQYPFLKIKNCLKIFDVADDYLEMLKYELGKFNNKLLIWLGAYLLGRMIEKSDLTIVVSNVLADSIPQSQKKWIKVLPNGVSLKPAVSENAAAIRSKYARPIIGFIGSFEYFIDFELILGIAERCKGYTFLLVGSGRDFAYVKSQVENKGLTNVILTGGVPHSKIAAYIDAMDICLNVFKKIPISHSACPIKLFEYLSMKKPVISTRLKELENIDEGFIYYADTIEEMENSIKAILHDADLTARRTEKGYLVVKNKYQWETITANFLGIIEEFKKAQG